MSSTRIPLFDRFDALLALVCGGAAFAVYARTLVPGLLLGDSGEFQVLAYQVGVAHTTGYPVYILLAKLFATVIPASSIAHRINLFSAFMAGLSVAGVYLCGRLLGGRGAPERRAAGVLAALTLTVSYTFWSQAVIAEVYTIGAAFLVAVCLFLLIWQRTGARWAVAAAGLCGALGLGAHSSVGMFAPAVVLFLLLDARHWRRWLIPALIGAGAGLGLYALTFLAVDLHAPPANIFEASYGPSRSLWGLSPADLQSPLKRIVFVAAGGQWHSAMFSNPGADMPDHMGKYVAGLPREFAPLALVLAALGVAALLRRDRHGLALVGAGLLAQWLCYFNYEVGDIYVFYIPTYIFLSLLAGAGLAGVLDLVVWRLGRLTHGRGRGPAYGVSILLTVAALAFAVGPVLGPRWGALVHARTPFIGDSNFPADRSTAALPDRAAALVRGLDRGAIVFTDWNMLWPCWYVAQFELDRTDLRFIETAPRSDQGGMADSVAAFVQANAAQRPVYFVDGGSARRLGIRLSPASVGGWQLWRVTPGL
jgi:hypothetical protein